MKVFIFDLLPYAKHFDQYKETKYLPYPLPRDHFDPEIGARTYEEHLKCWEEMDKLGYDGVGLNEHHTTPHGLMNSPNMMAAVAAQRTKQLKFLLLGNLVPLHNPLRIAEELAMADCLSHGRILSGFARGVPREYNVYGVSMGESRARFEEAVDIIMKAWTEPKFSYEGKFWSYKDIAIWPRPYQQPHPPVWVPFTGSKETIEWAAKHNFSAVIPDHHRGLTQDIVGYFAKQLAANGHADHAGTDLLFRRCLCGAGPRHCDQGIQPVLSLFRAHAVAPRLARRSRRQRAPAICRRRRTTTSSRRTGSARASTARA